MLDRTANLLGALSLAVADRIEGAARAILNHSGETPAALVVIGYDLGPSNEQLRRILRLSHPGTVRLVDRLVADGLAERKQGSDKRVTALYLTDRGHAVRDELLRGRIEALRLVLHTLSERERVLFASLLEKILPSVAASDADRCTICRLCDDGACLDCPIPAAFKEQGEAHQIPERG